MPDPRRRAALGRLLGMVAAHGLGALPLGAFAQERAAAAPAITKRRALVIGNCAYQPERDSILSARKNARDMTEVLKQHGFDVQQQIDVGTQAMRTAIQAFWTELKADGAAGSLGVFYFSGHGLQHRDDRGLSRNYIVPSDVQLNQRPTGIVGASIDVERDLIGEGPVGKDSTAVLIFDTCRNDPTKSATESNLTGFKPVEPPPGTFLAFSTQAGKVAIAPRSEDENSIYTRFLLEELRKLTPEMPLEVLFDRVGRAVHTYMSVEAQDEFLKRHAQEPQVSPHLATHLRLRLSLALQKEKAPPPVDDREQKAWARIEQLARPADRVQALQAFIDDFKASRFIETARTLLTRAKEAVERGNLPPLDNFGDEQFRNDQKSALDGDKDAARRVGFMFRNGSNGAPRDERKMVVWLRHAARLKDGIAAYELSKYYRERNLDRDAVNYENLAVSLGYTLPLRIASGK